MKDKRIFLVIIAMFAVVGLAFAQDGKTYKIGDKGPGGGIVFYYSQEGFAVIEKGTCYYLEAAPVNQGTLAWASSGYSDRNITEAVGEQIGRGRTNTFIILVVDPNAPAAKACLDYRGGGFDDWFLPNRNELNEMYKARTHIGISSGSFWSSIQAGYRPNAWYLDFGSGVQNGSNKNTTFLVRAIRAF